MLITNATILTFDSANRVIEGGAVLVENGMIRDIGKTETLVKRHRDVKTDDAKGMVMMPGLTNAHMHLYSTLARGMSLPGKPPTNFEEILQHLWWRLDKALKPDDVRISALVPLIGGIRSGTTSLIDHHASPNAIEGSLDIIAETVKQTGVRAALCYEVSDRDGGKIARQGLDENIRFLERVARDDDPMLKGHFGLHAQFTIEDKTLQRATEAAKNFGAGIHIHCAEGFADLANAMQRHDCSAVERLARAGALGPNTILAHCVHVNADDCKRIAESDAFVSHQPRSNMNNAVGAIDIHLLRKAGINLALGTDGMSNNMWDEIRTCHLIHNHTNADPGIGMGEANSMLFDGNRALAERVFGVKTGRIAKGHAADLILVDYLAPTPLTKNTVMGHVFFGMGDSPVNSTMINGKWAMRNRKLRLRGIDEAEIAAESRALAKRLWKRI